MPLHSSTLEVLMAYAERRDQIYAPRQVPYFFVSSHGTRLFATNAGKIFRDLSRHDFRHRFAVETLLSWYRNGEPVIRRMPVLSTYMGHGSVTGTYWYLSNTPELMTAASERLEARWKGVLP